jgi:hypothetical protein
MMTSKLFAIQWVFKRRKVDRAQGSFKSSMQNVNALPPLLLTTKRAEELLFFLPTLGQNFLILEQNLL